MDQLLPICEVSEFTSLGKTTIYVLIRAGEFPKNVQVSKRRVAWRRSDIQQWLSERAEATSQQTLPTATT